MILSDETCDGVQDALGALLSGEATREEMRRANRHLDACAVCQREFAALAGFQGRLRNRYGVEQPRSRRVAVSIAGLALAASLIVGVVVTRLPGEWFAVVETPTPVTVAEVIPATEEFVDDVWIDLLSDEEIEDLVVAALEP